MSLKLLVFVWNDLYLQVYVTGKDAVILALQVILRL
jgi:hypothetical protein